MFLDGFLVGSHNEKLLLAARFEQFIVGQRVHISTEQIKYILVSFLLELVEDRETEWAKRVDGDVALSKC
jgi:hypothetical protein